jgi:Spy/CpxP family protein refolding chaperone
MKRQLITFAAFAAFVCGSLTTTQAEDFGPPGHGHGRMGDPLSQVIEALNLTEAQKAQVQPILDQAKPQVAAIHQEAMQKMRSVMEATTAQIRPLLTAEQQQKLDATKKAHEDMAKAIHERHELEKK